MQPAQSWRFNNARSSLQVSITSVKFDLAFWNVCPLLSSRPLFLVLVCIFTVSRIRLQAYTSCSQRKQARWLCRSWEGRGPSGRRDYQHTDAKRCPCRTCDARPTGRDFRQLCCIPTIIHRFSCASRSPAKHRPRYPWSLRLSCCSIPSPITAPTGGACSLNAVDFRRHGCSPSGSVVSSSGGPHWLHCIRQERIADNTDASDVGDTPGSREDYRQLPGDGGECRVGAQLPSRCPQGSCLFVFKPSDTSLTHYNGMGLFSLNNCKWRPSLHQPSSQTA